MTKKTTVIALAVALAGLSMTPMAYSADATKGDDSKAEQKNPCGPGRKASANPCAPVKKKTANPCGPANPCAPKKRKSVD